MTATATATEAAPPVQVQVQTPAQTPASSMPYGAGPVRVTPFQMGADGRDAVRKVVQDSETGDGTAVVYYVYHGRRYDGALSFWEDRIGPDGAKFGREQHYVLYPSTAERDAARRKQERDEAARLQKATEAARLARLEDEMRVMREMDPRRAQQ